MQFTTFVASHPRVTKKHLGLVSTRVFTAFVPCVGQSQLEGTGAVNTCFVRLETLGVALAS